MKTLLILLLAGVVLPVWASPPDFTPAGQERGRSDGAREQSARESSSRGSQGRVSDKSRDSEGLLPALTSTETEGLIGRVLEEYFGLSAPETRQAYNQRALPPGLQRKLDRGGSLPPGWQNKLARGEVLSADIYRQGVRLPNDYGRYSQDQQDETELLLLGDKIVRVVQGQGTILDVIDITSAILQPR
ncbi:hypothetical protein [Nitrincola iocasae]|uniref:Uncharacterized protein n=1 Tax=Nitrincola iocasae TaxID=2614693 RepID=A0A5J6LF91_9GAMM|nr:hypothetical protein [Nitrincola iocasae]QEW07006.1 hypothetical protein F5I99_11065 [Nitrincola iocasae]